MVLMLMKLALGPKIPTIMSGIIAHVPTIMTEIVMCNFMAPIGNPSEFKVENLLLMYPSVDMGCNNVPPYKATCEIMFPRMAMVQIIITIGPA
jgi:hypothetical protein